MKVLSLLQPWASLVVMGVKKIETRSWSTNYRGPLLIHASQSKKGGFITSEEVFKKYISSFISLPFGAIIGRVTLEKILPADHFGLDDHAMNRLTLEEKAFGDYSEGRYGWVLTDAEAFDEPIITRGHLNLWEYEMI